MDRPALDVDLLRSTLVPGWARIDVVEQTASTNADLLGADGAPDRSVLAAELQVAGRGRLDRTWTSPPRAGLTVSVLLRPSVPLARWSWLPLLTGVAIAEAVDEVAGIAVTLKWPNDVLAADNGKLAGILVQTARDAVVLGFGFNVSTTAAELPTGAATSLALQGVGETDRTALLLAVLGALDAWVQRWVDAGGDAAACGLAAAYRARCSTPGRRVVVSGQGAPDLLGDAVGVDDAGRLVVRDAAGEHAVSAGDVQHVRPA